MKIDTNKNQPNWLSLNSEISIRLNPDLLEVLLILETYYSLLMIFYKISDAQDQPSAN